MVTLSAMWLPDTADEVLTRLAAGDLEETATFEGKQGAPKNPDLAVDVAAMTVNGGVLLFGVGENAEGTRLTQAGPIDLAGQRERVQQMVATGISEPPAVDIRGLPMADDPSKGFLAVIVPASPQAPHQITLSGKYEGRFYTRDATGNRILGQTEIEQLYARRARWNRDSETTVREAFKREVHMPDEGHVCLALTADPIAASADLLRRSQAIDPRQQLRTAVEQAIRVGPWRYDMAGFAGLVSWEQTDADSWRAWWHYESDPPELLAVAERSGRLTVISRRIGAPHPTEPGPVLLYEQLFAAVTTRALVLAGQIAGHANYAGPIDVALLVAPLRGVYSAARTNPHYIDRGLPYGADDYFRAGRMPANELISQPIEVARRLTADLLEATVGSGFDPFV
jgi:hypothetical protein